MDEQGATSEVTYTYQDDQALFLRSLEPGESFIDGNGNMFTADFDGRIYSGSAELAYDYFTRTEYQEQVNDFTYDFKEPNQFDLLTPIPTGDGGIDDPTSTNTQISISEDKNKIKKVKNKNKNKQKKFKIKYPKPKGTILNKGGKFKLKGNKRTRNKNINFSGRRRF